MESLEEFYEHKINKKYPTDGSNAEGAFRVFRNQDAIAPGKAPIRYTRRDFYKIALMRGAHVYHYADRSVATQGSTLMFFTPQVPYAFEQGTDPLAGYFCIFRAAFFTEGIRSELPELPMFASGHTPCYSLSEVQDQHITQLFEKMLEEARSDYSFKYDLIRNFVIEIIHHALKRHPAKLRYAPADASARLTAVFTELLERQFPIESTAQRLTMRSASDYADSLAVHVNYLNRVLRKTTGKTTTELIAERLTSEAKALLKYTDWNVAEIGYSLGFEEPTHFTHFFKRRTDLSPSAFRT